MNNKDSRQIRIFISSTFRDMRAERDELVKYIFPKLKKICSLRNVGLMELELRWGVTAEEAVQGKALEICLGEVDYCRPFFIGILGERYGWIPQTLSASLIKKHPWIAGMSGKSISEIEIIYGALQKKDKNIHPYFYFRDPAYLKHLPVGFNISDFTSENSTAQEKQTDLKKQIKRNAHCICRDYLTPKEFGGLVYKDLLELINQLFPVVPCSSVEELEEQQQEAFARNLREFYIKQEDHWRKLDSFMKGSSSILAVTGESGSGKSALLANWMGEFQENHPEILLMSHFVDSSTFSSDYSYMLHRFIRMMNSKLGLNIEISKQISDLRNSFANALFIASTKKPMLFLIDSIDRLNNADASAELAWLPTRIPDNVHIILSSKPGELIEKLQSTGVELLKTRPFTQKESLHLIQNYLSMYHKRLPKAEIEKIIKATKTMNPLFLHSLLFELRLYGDHDTLKDWLASLLEAKSVSSLFDMILTRFEKDYNQDRPNLVQDSFSLILCSRFGLTEQELLDLLGTGGKPLFSNNWSYLSTASGPLIANQFSSLKILHTFFQKAIEKKYLKNPEAKELVHQKLANYWAYKENSPRKIMEYPWHLAKSKNYARLVDELTDMNFFAELFENHKADLFSYWNIVENNSVYRKETAYQTVLEELQITPLLSLVYLVEFYMLTGLSEASIDLCEAVEKRSREEHNHPCLVKVLILKADILASKGQLKEALKVYHSDEELFRHHLPSLDTASFINSQASLLYQLGQWPEAFEMFIQAEEAARNNYDQIGLSEAINNKALVMENWAKVDEAWNLHKESEMISREMHDMLGLSISMSHQARILRSWNKTEEALLRYKEAETISKDLGNLFSLALSLNNQALILSSEKRLTEAGKLYKEAENIFRKLDEQTQLSALLINQASLLKNWGKTEEAWDLYKEAETIFRKTENPLKLSICLNNEASLLYEWGKWDESLLLYKEAEQIFRNLNYQKGIAISLSHQGTILLEQNQQDSALKLLKEALKIAKDNKLTQLQEQIQKNLDNTNQT